MTSKNSYVTQTAHVSLSDDQQKYSYVTQTAHISLSDDQQEYSYVTGWNSSKMCSRITCPKPGIHWEKCM